MGVLIDINTLITSETNKFIGDMPDTPNNAICLYSTGGYNSKHSLGDSVAPTLEEPTFMIRVRDSSYASGNTRSEAITNLLNGKVNQTINNNIYLNIFMIGNINGIGKDDKNRSEFTINFRTKMKRN